MKKLFFYSLAICISSQLAAEPVVQISGNDKTKTAYIEKLTRICLKEAKKRDIFFPREDLRNEIMKTRIRQCLLNSNLFSEVNIPVYRETEDGAREIIEIEVEDKFSQIVLPTYQQSQASHDTVWGALFYDANVRGRGESSGFLYTHQENAKRDSFSFFYEIPYLDERGKHGFTLIGYKRDTDFYSYTKTRWVYSTREQFRFLWLRGRYHINNKISLLYGYAPSYLAYSNSLDRDSGRQADDIEYTAQTINLGMVWDDTDQVRYYREGTMLEQIYYRQLSRTDKEEVSGAYLFNFYWGIPSPNQNILTTRISGGTYSRANELDNLRIGSEHGSRGIPYHGAWNNHYLTLGLDYEFPLVRGQYGYWTLAPFVDYGYQWEVFHHPESEFDYYATGLSTYVYLRKVNVPALGLFFSSNSEYLKDFVSFYIGFRL